MDMRSNRKTMATLQSKVFGSNGIIRYISNGLSSSVDRVFRRTIFQGQVMLNMYTTLVTF